MTKKIVIANWKLNPLLRQEAGSIFNKIKNNIRGIKNTEAVICPPFAYLESLSRLMPRNVNKRHQKLFLGVQDIFWEEKGAYTGEISSVLVKQFGVTHAIIGHSERRKWLGETDEMLNKKIKAVLKAGLTPVLCIGEWEREEGGELPPIVGEQLKAALTGIRKGQFKKGIIAYEPVWAIGTGRAETPDNAVKAAIYIRRTAREILGRKNAASLRVIYGGSVNAKNAASFISKDILGMEGMLVGGASLDAKEFVEIVKSVDGI